MLYPIFRPEPGLSPRSHQLKGRLTSPCKDIRAGGWGKCANQLDQYLREEGVSAECWPGGVRLLVIFRGIQQISKYIEHNGSQISSSWERQIQINTGKAVNPIGLVLDWNLRYRC